MYTLKEDGCVPFELTKEEYQKCVNTIRQMRISEFDKVLERALQTCGLDAVKDKLVKIGLI
jgi:hypothetical protein